ncbi:MAG: hypothetical protein KKG35_12925, partial [Proteobacteria bacterium]|nr:hypothetical protein [Pseudomonadota bacterium]
MERPGRKGFKRSVAIFWRQATIIATVALAAWLTIQTPKALAENEGHPLISAYKGSVLIGREVKEFDEQLLVVSKVQADNSVKTEKLAGKVTKVEYQDPGDRSSLERMRNYELSLKKAGFEVVFKCANEECGPEIQLDTIGYYPPQRYMTARLKRSEGDVWAGIYIPEGPRMKIWVVEEQPMETDMVSISADQLKDSL